MAMLSRVAERLYWFGRYVERVENTARLVGVNAQLLLDMPDEAEVLWRSLVEILGCGPRFAVEHPQATERAVMRYVLADESVPSSIVSALRMARENARTVREILPSEAWELINALYHETRESVDGALARRHRQAFLDGLVMHCHQLSGMLMTTMSQREPHHFVNLGWSLERADMTTRILDVGTIYAAGARTRAQLVDYEGVLWMNVLLSLSAYQMYRQQTRGRVAGAEVVGFLLQDDAFPHAIACCLDTMEHSLGALPRNRGPLAVNREIVAHLRGADPARLLAGGLHDYLDQLQGELARLHAQIEATWFRAPA
jgi:uncharacterized alpha-E superfamily protein